MCGEAWSGVYRGLFHGSLKEGLSHGVYLAGSSGPPENGLDTVTIKRNTLVASTHKQQKRGSNQEYRDYVKLPYLKTSLISKTKQVKTFLGPWNGELMLEKLTGGLTWS